MQRSGATTWLDSATPPPPPRPLITRPSKTHPPFQPAKVRRAARDHRNTTTFYSCA